MDPYVEFLCNGVKQKTKTHFTGGKSPSWKDTITFDCSKDDFVSMTVWDEDTLSANDFIGEGQVPVAKITKAASGYKDWISIHYKGRESGKVYIEAHYISSAKAPVPGAYPG